jgi:hypothetical protein
MKRLPPAKRNQLIMVIVATIAALALVFMMLIQPQKVENEKLGLQIRAQQDRLNSIESAMHDTAGIAAHLTDISSQLDLAENDIASGDVYAWTYDTIRRFKANYHVDIPSIGQPSISDMDMLPGFPYRQVRVTISGSAFYHDLGKFVSDFENSYPHMRMVNLTIEPANMTGTNAERLSFRVDVVALIKPNS